MNTFQETNAGTRSTQEDMKVRYTAKTTLQVAGAAACAAVMMAG
jgi:hypothetical protein